MVKDPAADRDGDGNLGMLMGYGRGEVRPTGTDAPTTYCRPDAGIPSPPVSGLPIAMRPALLGDFPLLKISDGIGKPFFLR